MSRPRERVSDRLDRIISTGQHLVGDLSVRSPRFLSWLVISTQRSHKNGGFMQGSRALSWKETQKKSHTRIQSSLNRSGDCTQNAKGRFFLLLQQHSNGGHIFLFGQLDDYLESTFFLSLVSSCFSQRRATYIYKYTHTINLVHVVLLLLFSIVKIKFCTLLNQLSISIWAGHLNVLALFYFLVQSNKFTRERSWACGVTQPAGEDLL